MIFVVRLKLMIMKKLNYRLEVKIGSRDDRSVGKDSKVGVGVMIN